MRKERGFTLVELMVAISIVSILVAIAVPSWGRWLPVYRLKQASRDVLSGFQTAKMEAVRRNTNVVISFDPDNDGAITDEYIIFVDDGDGGGGIADNFIHDGTELLLGQFKMPKSVTLDSTTFTGSVNNAAGFNSRGLPVGNLIGRANLSNTKGTLRQIRLSITGKVRIHKP